MKKNFLMVASLLIAAMLMVVSCTQEVAPKNELVEVKLSTVFGRDIRIDGGTNTDNLKYKYTMTPNWNGWTASSGESGIGSENISGIVSKETDVEIDKSLGWVTPGLWTVKVYAYDGSQKVFEGENDAYFSNNNNKNKVTVYLKPVDNTNNSLTFEISMQDLDTNGGNYKLKYKVVGTPSISETIQPTENNVIEGTLVRDTNASSLNVSKYKLASDDNNLKTLPSDYYRVTVSIHNDDEGETLLGGITKGVLLSGGDAGVVTGNIEPSDYINAQFDVKLLHVNTSLTSSGVTYYSDKNYTNVITKPTENTEATEILAQSAKATITLTDNTDFDKFDGQSVKNDYSVVNKWYVDGIDQNVAGDSFELKDTTPGYKNVSCQTIYYKELDGVIYYWANTASIQVPFEGNKFAKD